VTEAEKAAARIALNCVRAALKNIPTIVGTYTALADMREAERQLSWLLDGEQGSLVKP
jgi:hypothetical protein